MRTIRSTPIKNYQASIAQSIGTHQRSLPRQYQFENDKRPDSFIWQKPRSNLRSAFSIRNFNGTPLINKRRLSKRSDRVNREYQTPTGIADPDASPDSLECYNFVNHINNNSRCSSSRLDSRKHATNNELRVVPNLESGNVVQKINAYEENSCCISEERRINSRLGMTEMKEHKSIGVPLVGMHNACGLPVIAHWQSSRLSKSSSTGQIFGSQRHLRSRSQTHPKRRATQDLGESHLKSGWTVIKKESRPLSAMKDVDKRPSFKAFRNGIFSAKKGLETGRDADRESIICRFSGSFSRRSGKRTTLYAKDGGDEAVYALKNLCLNPLARNNKGEVMIW